VTGARLTPDTTVGVTEPGLTPSAPVPPREGVTEAGLTGGTPATSPPAYPGEGYRAP
jgi:hypothetical protein